MYKSTRPTPSPDFLKWREAYLKNLGKLVIPLSSGRELSGLENGNNKTGDFGTQFSKIWVWNLPSVLTCPGSSSWCRVHCYNADPRVDVFPVDRWIANLSDYLYRTPKLEKKILEQLNSHSGKTAVRVHSSGDFFDAHYIKFWHRLATEAPHIQFWAYTRSWNDTSLYGYLNALRLLHNVELFASWDSTMPAPPEGWRRSIVIREEEQHDTVRGSEKSLLCPEQIGKAPNCASCGYCIHKHDGAVIFLMH